MRWKKLAWLIVGLATLAYFAARKPSTVTPDSSGAGSRPISSSGLISPASNTDSSPIAAPETPSTSGPSPSSPATTTPGPSVAGAPDPDHRITVAGDPPDVVEETRNAPAMPVETSKPVMQAPPLMMRAEREGAVHGCKSGGDLLLDELGVHFKCASDAGRNVEVSLADIRDVDKSGVIGPKGQKFHFDIQNTDAATGEKIFRDWLQHARLTAGNHSFDRPR